MPDTKRPLKVFLCHASADKPKVRELYRTLKRRGVQPWLDAEDLIPGQNWEVEIPKALLSSDAIIICLTPNSVDKEGYVQKEIKFALDKAMEMPEGRIFIIPARLEECDLPFSLKKYHAVELYEKAGYTKLMQSLKLRASQLERATVQLPRAGEITADVGKIVEEKKPPEPKEEKLEPKTSKSAQEKVGVGGDVKDSVIVSGSGNVINIGEQKKPEPEKPQPKKTKPPRKPNTAIIVALIGLAGTIIAALLGSPIIEKWFSPVPTATELAMVTATLTNRPAIASQTIEPISTLDLGRTPTAMFTPTVFPSPLAKDSGKIAFILKSEIYVTDSDGSNQMLLSNIIGSVQGFQWSPDGTKIAFSSTKENEQGLYVMNVDNGNKKLLAAQKQLYSKYFSWSPDGKKIVYVDDGLAIVSIDSAEISKLTTLLGIWEVAWSPNGSRIALSVNRNGLFLIDADGENQNLVFDLNACRSSTGNCFISGLSWSPDGSSLVFYPIGLYGSGSGLQILHLDTMQVTQLTNDQNIDWDPVFSPDGTKIAFVSTRSQGVPEIFQMNSDGTEIAQLTNFFHNRVSLYDINWSPDGTKIAFTYRLTESFGDFHEDIYVIDLSSKEMINLSSGEEDSASIPVWVP